MKILAEKCIRCLTCVGVCPMQAVSKQDDGGPVIDKSICVECGCCVASCPAGAIVHE